MSKNIIDDIIQSISMENRDYELFQNISFDLNIYKIPNRIVNLNQFFTIDDDYYIILINDEDGYHIVDFNFNNYIIDVDDISFVQYLNILGIAKTNFLLDDIYNVKNLLR